MSTRTSTPQRPPQRGKTTGARRTPRVAVRRNDLLRAARLALPSPSRSGRPLSRQELAKAVNAHLADRRVRGCLTDKDIGRYERGESRWPRAHYRRALRSVLGAHTDAQLGFYQTNRQPSAETPLASVPVGGVPPVPVVLRWTGRKAYALRVAMRLSVREFAAKLGLSHASVAAWTNRSTALLRYETHQLLDSLLSRASDEELARFDLALQEMGETR